ncbi:MAG: hypothetical protein V4685_17190 [Bacteroidota bacterium]
MGVFFVALSAAAAKAAIRKGSKKYATGLVLYKKTENQLSYIFPTNVGFSI